MPSNLECIILVGLPGAGKSTLYRQRFAKTHVHISKDRLAKTRGSKAAESEILDQALAQGSSVVIDNTNPTLSGRAPLIAVAHARGARVIGYFFDLTTRAAVARNASRSGPDKVPNVAIFTTAKRLDKPSLSEGFDELFRVEVSKDRDFQITKM